MSVDDELLDLAHAVLDRYASPDTYTPDEVLAVAVTLARAITAQFRYPDPRDTMMSIERQYEYDTEIDDTDPYAGMGYAGYDDDSY